MVFNLQQLVPQKRQALRQIHKIKRQPKLGRSIGKLFSPSSRRFDRSRFQDAMPSVHATTTTTTSSTRRCCRCRDGSFSSLSDSDRRSDSGECRQSSINDESLVDRNCCRIELANIFQSERLSSDDVQRVDLSDERLQCPLSAKRKIKFSHSLSLSLCVSSINIRLMYRKTKDNHS